MALHFNFSELLFDNALNKWNLSDKELKDPMIKYIERNLKVKKDRWKRRPNQMFWPPRIIRAVKEDTLVPFFGSGISIAAGVPDWIKLLRKVGLDPDVESDPQIAGDMLTLAEVTALTNGSDNLQNNIRESLKNKYEPTFAHYLLATIKAPFYITTNYDNLFESAWKDIYGKAPYVITKDSDLVLCNLGTKKEDWEKFKHCENDACFIIKMHGCIDRNDEQMILTRSDYRKHYRENLYLIDFIRWLLLDKHVLFLGFSHKDPEISRLIEDVIFRYEQIWENENKLSMPGLYSLHFDMLKKTPEIFAARGIVAIQPPIIIPQISGVDVKGHALAQGMVDLFDNVESSVDNALWLDDVLKEIMDSIEKFNIKNLDILKNNCSIYSKDLNGISLQVLDSIREQLGEYANQGVYLLNSNGRIIRASCPDGLLKDKRIVDTEGNPINFATRPYFRQANSLRKPFISDSFESIYNGNLTLAYCFPIVDSGNFKGLVFSAYNVRENDFFNSIYDTVKSKGADLAVVDSNGILIYTSVGNIREGEPELLAIEDEQKNANIGINYWDVLKVSRTDKRIQRIVQNVVPLNQDDDVEQLSYDVLSYSVVSDIEKTRWKIALMQYLRLDNNK